MPSAPMKPCADRHCPELVPRGTTRCKTHQREDYRRKDSQRSDAELERRKVYQSARWRKVRQQILNRDPLCRSCRRAASREVDHIRPTAQGGAAFDPANLQGLCTPCHSRKTATEVLNG